MSDPVDGQCGCIAQRCCGTDPFNYPVGVGGYEQTYIRPTVPTGGGEDDDDEEVPPVTPPVDGGGTPPVTPPIDDPLGDYTPIPDDVPGDIPPPPEIPEGRPTVTVPPGWEIHWFTCDYYCFPHPSVLTDDQIQGMASLCWQEMAVEAGTYAPALVVVPSTSTFWWVRNESLLNPWNGPYRIQYTDYTGVPLTPHDPPAGDQTQPWTYGYTIETYYLVQL